MSPCIDEAFWCRGKPKSLTTPSATSLVQQPGADTHTQHCVSGLAHPSSLRSPLYIFSTVVSCPHPECYLVRPAGPYFFLPLDTVFCSEVWLLLLWLEAVGDALWLMEDLVEPPNCPDSPDTRVLHPAFAGTAALRGVLADCLAGTLVPLEDCREKEANGHLTSMLKSVTNQGEKLNSP